MFLVFVVAVIVLAMIGVGSLFGGGMVGLGALFLLPILLVKLAFFLMLFGFVGRQFVGRRPSWNRDYPGWVGRSRPRPEQPPAEREERFEEWHRMAHAREEVDGWVADLGDIEPE